MIDPTGHEVHWNPGEPEDYEPVTTTLRTLFHARLNRVLERLSGEAKAIRETCARYTPEDKVSKVWLPDADALDYAVAEIRAEMGMEESDED